ncbi:MAG: glycosyltransferase family 4 protein [Acidobacteria bacterium]|nr:glycosyltransferase family 4 protein [Acidobacteriota bacterium]
MQSPALAVVSLDRSGGGVAVVADLLWRVFQDHFGDRARLLSLLEGTATTPTLPDKLRFGARLAQAQLVSGVDWILFSHLALAKAHDRVPRRLRCGYGVFLHGIEAWNELSPRELRLLREANLRLSNSEYTARRVMDAHPEIGVVHPCPLALPPRIPATVGRSPVSLGPHAVLVVGRMASGERYKGHDQLIDCWPAVVASVPDAQLVFVGGGDDRERLEGRAAAGQVPSRIVFTGFVAESALDRLFEECAIFALPSRGEGFGLVYLEAMAHGRPCVGSVHDAAGDVIEDGVTGRLVDQADIQGLSTTLAALLVDEPLRRRMGEAGRARLRARFSFDRFRARVLHLLGATVPSPAMSVSA